MTEYQIFISRPQSKNSTFRSRLEAEGLQVVGESLIQFRPLPVTKLPDADWIFFYSKKGVKYLLESADASYLNDKKLACLGPGTASFLENAGQVPDFTGNGEPQEVAAAFLHLAIGQRVVFPQAKQSRQSVQSILESQINAISLPVYENEPRQDFELPYCQILVFTSPMNVSAYCSKYRIQKGQQCVAIGSVSATALVKQGIKEVIVAEEPSEEAMARAVLQIV